MDDEVRYKSSSHCPDGQCVQAAQLPDGSISVRDSKNLDQIPLTFTPAEWNAFVLGVKAEEFDFADRHRASIAIPA